MSRNFMELVHAKWKENKFLCVGLDCDFDKIPEAAKVGRGCTSIGKTIREFSARIVEATQDIAGVYKPNIAFFEKHGAEGLDALERVIADIHSQAPTIPVILDCKRADIGNTNLGYVHMAFGLLGADAVTVNPYFGQEALQPFLDRADKGIIVLCRTSNPGAGEFQDKYVSVATRYNLPLYAFVAHRVVRYWNTNDNCALVVGATHPEEEFRLIRQEAPMMPLLIPGVGTQGGEVETTVRSAVDKNGEGIIINASRSIIFASNGDDFAEAARREALKLHNQINACREVVVP